MGINIDKVDYRDIPSKAQQIRQSGQNLNTKLTTIYENVENMHSSWYGTRYNELVTKFNGIIIDLNSMLDLVVKNLPYTLEKVANNYAKADLIGSIVQETQTEPQKIVDISTPADVGMRFVEESVSATRDLIVSNFNDVVSIMNEIQSQYQEITWESDAATEFRSRFSTLKENITTDIEDIKKDFNTLMANTISDIQATENANNVNN